ncbi:MAG: hypothetical protein AAF383_25065 [Cyanobacteria bacterium P01_A01_bin.83]
MEGEALLLFLVLLVGITIIVSILIKASLERIGIPPLFGYLLFGVVAGLINSQVLFLSPPVKEVYAFLAELGIISLLFRVGKISNLSGLIRQLPRASFILLGNLACSGIAMVIMERGRQLGGWAVSPQIYTSMIMVSAITCIISPSVLRPLLQKQFYN